jgi:hypothetical protein
LAATQRNFKWYRYVDDKARNWAIRADADWGDSAASGLAAFNVADPPFGRQSNRHHPRFAIYQDPTTFRTFKGVVGTAAAYAALAATHDVVVPGEVAAVTYNLAGTIPEKLQLPKAARNLIDHP